MEESVDSCVRGVRVLTANIGLLLQECHWPLVTENEYSNSRLCNVDATRTYQEGGLYPNRATRGYACPGGAWCGSNFDAKGNRRFKASKPNGTKVSGEFNDEPMNTWQLTQSGTFTEDLLYGIPSFDSFPRAFMVVFQCVTLEAWTPIMYGSNRRPHA